MPSYTFECQECGPFTLFYKQMAGDKQTAVCPTCLEKAKRIYFAPHLITGSHVLRQRIEKGMEPKIVSKSELAGRKIKPPSYAPRRPWQVGH